ncbi:MAG TPA: choice-of-anchor B family protein [Planctomycetota bacterium]|nr:choice-of-anchor B family protein [Planctomycetota bacterium]
MIPGPLLAAALLVVALPAQTSTNVQLLGTFDPQEMSSGVWGWTDPVSGTELAFLLTDSGTYVLDCTNGTPVQRAFFPGPQSGWREAKTWGSYAYVVTEGGGGMQVIDLHNPAAPQLVGTHTVAGWANTHTIAVDAKEGKLYCCGTNLGMLVFDVAANPTAPPLVASFTGFYVHDAHVQDGYAHLCDIYGHRYFIADVSNLPTITVVGSAAAPGRRFFHNAWATRDNDYAVGTSEAAGGPLSVWDIRIKAAPILIAQVHPAPATAVIHLAIERERVVHVAYYTEGYMAFDLSDPAQPVVVGNYDTYPGASSGFNGAWGVYPLREDGVVYISDMQSGLFVLRPASAVARYGEATAGGSGRKPAILGFGAAYLGNTRFQVQCADALPLSPGVLALGATRSNLNVAGLHLHVDLSAGAVTVPLATDAAGEASVPLPVPAVPQLAGRQLYAQGFVLDPGGPFNLSATRGLEITVIAP